MFLVRRGHAPLQVEAARVLVETNCRGHTIEKAIAFDDTSPLLSLYLHRTVQVKDALKEVNCIQQHALASCCMFNRVSFMPEVIEGIAPEELQKVLTGRKLLQACRKGKHMWMELDGSAPALMFHFGATHAVAA